MLEVDETRKFPRGRIRVRAIRNSERFLEHIVDHYLRNKTKGGKEMSEKERYQIAKLYIDRQIKSWSNAVQLRRKFLTRNTKS